jgi:hypothetical protein
MLTVDDRFPTFRLTAVTSLAPGREFEEVTDASHPGKWCVVRQLGPDRSHAQHDRREHGK